MKCSACNAEVENFEGLLTHIRAERAKENPFAVSPFEMFDNPIFNSPEYKAYEANSAAHQAAAERLVKIKDVAVWKATRNPEIFAKLNGEWPERCEWLLASITQADIDAYEQLPTGE